MAFDTCTIILGPLLVLFVGATATYGIRSHNAKNDIKRVTGEAMELQKKISRDTETHNHIMRQVAAYHDEKGTRKEKEVAEGWLFAHKVLDELEESLKREDEYMQIIRSLTRR